MADSVVVRVISVEGSAPRETGARMIVGRDTLSGTIGGGRLEYDAIALAREILAGTRSSFHQTVHLGPEIGQCCGGKVELEYAKTSTEDQEKMDKRDTDRSVFIFGGGHVGSAIAQSLAKLPVQVTVVETRPEYAKHLPEGVDGCEIALPEVAVKDAQPRSAFVVVTHDHALDFLIVEEALRREDAAYVGMIGSKSKRAVLEHQLVSKAIDPKPLHCPIGSAGLGDKRPEVIAAFVAVEVLLALRGKA